MSSIVVIGSGLAGYNFIKEFRRLNQEQEITLICADSGDFYSKPMLSAALGKGQSPDQLALFSIEKMAEKENFRYFANTEVTGIDTSAKRIETSIGEVPYQDLVLAQGAIPIPLKINEFTPLSVNNLEDYRHFRSCLEGKQRVTIIGGGLVGCEFAHDLATAGYQVDLVALSDYPLNLLVPREVGLYIEGRLKDLAIDWHWQCGVDQVVRENDSLVATLSSGKTITSDLILSAIGLKANTGLAKSARLALGNGIVVDNYLKTSAENVYALGDCAEIEGHSLHYVLPLMAAARSLAQTLNGSPTALTLPAMPITVKLPTCPTTLYPPPIGVEVEWRIESDEEGLQALAYANHKLAGFALCGKRCSQRAELQRQLPPLLS